MPFIMHAHRLPHFAQGRFPAVRANCERIVGVMLVDVKALSAVGTFVYVNGHNLPHFHRNGFMDYGLYPDLAANPLSLAVRYDP